MRPPGSPITTFSLLILGANRGSEIVFETLQPNVHYSKERLSIHHLCAVLAQGHTQFDARLTQTMSSGSVALMSSSSSSLSPSQTSQSSSCRPSEVHSIYPDTQGLTGPAICAVSYASPLPGLAGCCSSAIKTTPDNSCEVVSVLVAFLAVHAELMLASFAKHSYNPKTSRLV